MANAKAQKKQAAVNMAGKPSRQEILNVLQPVANKAEAAFNGLVALADFLVTKGVFTSEELNLFIAGRNSQATAQQGALQANEQQALPPAPQTIEGEINHGPVGSTTDIPEPVLLHG